MLTFRDYNTLFQSFFTDQFEGVGEGLIDRNQHRQALDVAVVRRSLHALSLVVQIEVPHQIAVLFHDEVVYHGALLFGDYLLGALFHCLGHRHL